MIGQPVTLSGYAEWPKVADAMIEADVLYHARPRSPGRAPRVCPDAGPFVGREEAVMMSILRRLFAPELCLSVGGVGLACLRVPFGWMTVVLIAAARGWLAFA
jgi:hypothetical protein